MTNGGGNHGMVEKSNKQTKETGKAVKKDAKSNQNDDTNPEQKEKS